MKATGLSIARTLVSHLTSVALIAVLWSVVLVHIPKIYKGLHFDHGPCDFCVNYASAVALRRGLSPYTFDITSLPLGAAGMIPHATDPPTYLLLFEPFTFLAPAIAFWTWIALNSLALIASLVLLVGPRSGVKPEIALTLAALAFLYPPLDWHFNSSQNKLFLLFMLVLVMHWLERRREAAAGLLLALAGLLRIFPLLLFGYLILQRRWRAVSYTIVGLAVGGLITLSVVGVEATFGFLHAASFLTEKQWLDLNGNASLASIVSRMFWETDYRNVDYVRPLSIGFAWLALLGVTVIATLAGSWEEDCDSRAYSLWIVASVMLSPTAFAYDLVLLIIPFAQLAVAASWNRASKRAICAAFTSYVMIRNPDLLRQAFLLVGSPLHHFSSIVESSFFALMFTYVATLWFLVD